MFQNLISLDTQVSLFFRSLVLASDPAAKFVTFFADSEVLLVVIFLLVWWFRGSFSQKIVFKIQALDVFYAIVLAFAGYWLLNLGLPMRARPETISALPPLISHLPDNSFPSGHAIFASASVYAIAKFISGKIAGIFGIIALIMLFARVIAGVHYFGDILVGAILGVLFGIAYTCFRKRMSDTHFLFAIPIKIAAFIKL